MSGPDDFNDEQKRYLEGFVSGQAAARAAKGLGPLFPTGRRRRGRTSGPEAIHFRAQSRFIVEGKKLVAEEEAKRKKHPLDMWDEMAANAREARFPKGTDVFLYKFHGLFYVAPAQDSFMCRLRIPGGILDAHQLRGVADLAEHYGGGYATSPRAPTCRSARSGRRARSNVLTGSPRARAHLARRRRRQHPQHHRHPDRRHRPAGALRHAAARARDCTTTSSTTASSTACRASSTSPSTAAARVASLEDTNDIGFIAVRVRRQRRAAGRLLPRRARRHHRPSGFRPRHRRAAQARGMRAGRGRDRARLHRARRSHRPQEGAAEIRARPPGARRGSRRSRDRSSAARCARVPLADCEPRPPVDQHGHIGVHAADAAGPASTSASCCRSGADRRRRCASSPTSPSATAAARSGSPSGRTCSISDIAASRRRRGEARASKRWASAGGRRASAAASSRAPATPAASSPPPTPSGHALAIADHLDGADRARPAGQHPPHRLPPFLRPALHRRHRPARAPRFRADDAEVEGYHVYRRRRLRRPTRRSAAKCCATCRPTDVPASSSGCSTAYLEHRRAADEPFHAFAQRHSVEQLRAWCRR